MGKIIWRAGFLLLGFALAIFLTELLLRILWNPPYLNPKYKRDDFSWMSRNVVLNNFGYRDKDTALVKNPDTIRIYSLGDSFTYGWYIDDPDLSYPNVLEIRLQEQFGDKKIEVINASQPGFKIQDSVERFRTEGMLFSPDIVTLGINLFDLTGNEFPPKKPKFKFLVNLRLWQITFGNLERMRISRLTEKELKDVVKPESEQFKRAIGSILELNELTALDGGILILVIFPEYDSYAPNNSYLYNEFHQSLKKVINQKSRVNIVIIDLLKEFEKIKDKRELVLNPTDNHPTVLAHSIAADAIIKNFEFANFLTLHKSITDGAKTKRVSVGDDLGNVNIISSIKGAGDKWEYFDRRLDLGIQKKILENTGERRIPFMADYIKTVKSLTHNGWPGAKLEMHFPGVKEIEVNKKVYGYTIVGISQITAFGRKDGATFSRDLDLSEVIITRDSQSIKIKILTDEVFDFYKINFDTMINQFDIDKEHVVSFSKTIVITGILRKNEQKVVVNWPQEKYSLALFLEEGENYNYVWYDNFLKKAKIAKVSDGFEISLPLANSGDISVEFPIFTNYPEAFGPLINYR